MQEKGVDICHCLPLESTCSKSVFQLEGAFERNMSKVTTAIVCENAERRILRSNPGIPWKQVVCHVRYIDDIILLSRCYCHCLVHLVDSINKHERQVDLA